MTVTRMIAVASVGLVVGFFGGLFGKGGSAIATPLLAALGVPPILAVASPLPATIPGAFVSAHAYARRGHVDRRLVTVGALVGLPATVLGAVASGWVGGNSLVVATEALLLGLGIRLITQAEDPRREVDTVDRPTARIALVAAGVGLVSGLLANAGGFLLAPLLVVVLHRPLKDALGTSVALATILAVPGTAVHAALGHIDWAVTLVFAAASLPFARLGAMTALRMRAHHLQHLYGAVLVVFAAVCLIVTR